MILVADDDKTIRLSLKLILERNGYEVALAEEPKETGITLNAFVRQVLAKEVKVAL